MSNRKSITLKPTELTSFITGPAYLFLDKEFHNNALISQNK